MSALLIQSPFIDQVKHKLKISSDKVIIENQAFRLFSKLTVAILFLCCGLVTLQQLVGNVSFFLNVILIYGFALNFINYKKNVYVAVNLRQYVQIFFLCIRNMYIGITWV